MTSRSILLRMWNVSDKFVNKIKTQILYSATFFFFRKSWCLWSTVEKYCTARQATDDNIARRMRIACWITKGTLRIYRVSQNLCHKLFLVIPHPQLSKNVPINMRLKVNKFRDIHCCVEIREMLWSTPVTNIDELWERIVATFDALRNRPGQLERVGESMMRHLNGCVAANGQHFEHLM